MEHKKEAFGLYHSFSHMVIAAGCLEDLKKDKSIHTKAKYFLNRCANRLNVNIRELQEFFGNSVDRKTIEAALSAESTLQADNVRIMFESLPDAKRDEVERYIELQYRIYKQNRK